jgi:prepilin-type N-terminal cleavage/methylation domain-containing protein
MQVFDSSLNDTIPHLHSPFSILHSLAKANCIPYAYYMNQRMRGFTLVEVLITVIAITIIGGIALVGLNTVSLFARDKARETDTTTWASSFDLYKSRYIVYPAMPTADTPGGDVTLCLGTFTSFSNKCGQYTSGTATKFLLASGSASLMTEVAKIGNAPVNGEPSLKSQLVGPIVDVTQTTTGPNITVTAQFINFFEGSCPRGFVGPVSAATVAANYAAIAQVMTGVTANFCYLQKQFTYTPG